LILLFASINFSFYILVLFSCIIIHEMGHIIFIKINKLQILSIEILPFGINIATVPIGGNKLTSYKTDIIIALSGPFANILFSAVILLTIKINGYGSILFFSFLTNILYASINLFPVKSLDGGRISEIVLKILLPENLSYIVYTAISAIFLAILSVFALFVLMVTGYNFTLILLCCYLFYTIHFSPGKREK